MPTKLNIALIMGGPSVEHQVSLNSGANILTGLDLNRYNVLPVVINRQSKWLFAPEYITDKNISNQEAQQITQALNFLPFSEPRALTHLQQKRPTVVFLALHGEYGEDGTIQRLLEAARLDYTGSGILSSALGMDKPKSLAIFRRHNILVPDFVIIEIKQWPDDKEKILRRISKNLKYPLIVKPANRGSSLGVSLANNLTVLFQSINTAFDTSQHIMIQEYINGRELTCAVLGHEPQVIALPPTEIIPPAGSFFNYQAKYETDASQEITPANLPTNLIEKTQETALHCHNILGCRGLSRIDFILNAKNQLYVLELNTLPGMTKTSLLPQAALAAGINFSQLLDKIILAAVKK